VLSVAQAATHSGRGAETIRRWIRSGRLTAHRSGGRLFVHQDDLDALIARPAHDPPAGWSRTSWGTRQPDWVGELRRARGGRRLARWPAVLPTPYARQPPATPQLADVTKGSDPL